MDGWYYLHSETKDLIYKRFEPEADSSFVLKVWPIDVSKREDAWTVILEALALGADPERIRDLAIKWKCDKGDLLTFLARVSEPGVLLRAGLRRFLPEIANTAYDTWMDWLAKTPPGTEPDWSTMP
jgi:hypothetical protein